MHKGIECFVSMSGSLRAASITVRLAKDKAQQQWYCTVDSFCSARLTDASDTYMLI